MTLISFEERKEACKLYFDIAFYIYHRTKGKKVVLVLETDCMSGSKVLIVDDDTDDVEILAEAFTQSGVESVKYVHSAMQAFVYLESVDKEENLPKLIVTDLYLPGITGAEFLKDLKGMEKYKHIHVIVLTSIKTQKEIEALRQLGVVDYLIKPSSYDEYVEVAKSIVAKVK